MEHADIVRALRHGWPGSEWDLIGTDIDGLQWFGPGSKPTLQDIADVLVGLPPADAPTVRNVIEERKRRLALGFDYDFGDERGVHRIGTTPKDMEGWDEVTKFATALLNAGNTTATIDILTNTGPTQVTAAEWNDILIAAGEFRQPIWLASFALQQMDPIPEDYADDKWWPAAA